MRSFTDVMDRAWIATAREEATPRHHGRWHLVFHPASAPDQALAMPEVRWQARASAERTLRTMSGAELRRRLRIVQRRSRSERAAG